MYTFPLTLKEGWGNGLVDKTLARQACGPEPRQPPITQNTEGRDKGFPKHLATKISCNW